MLALTVVPHLSVEEIKALYKKTENNKLERKYLAISKLYEDKNAQQVASELIVAPQIVRKWIDGWNECGPEGLVDAPQPGRPPFLSEREQAELVEDLLTSPLDIDYDYCDWTLKIIARHMKRTYNREMALIGIWRMLKRHGMTRIVPKPLPAKVDTQKTGVSREKAADNPEPRSERHHSNRR